MAKKISENERKKRFDNWYKSYQPERKKAMDDHGLWDKDQKVSVESCQVCGNMGIGLQTKNGVCKQCRYKSSGSTKPYKFFRD